MTAAASDRRLDVSSRLVYGSLPVVGPAGLKLSRGARRKIQNKSALRRLDLGEESSSTCQHRAISRARGVDAGMLREALIANSVCQNSTRAEPLDKAQTKAWLFAPYVSCLINWDLAPAMALKLFSCCWIPGLGRCSCSGQQFHPSHLPEDPLKAEPSTAAAGRMKRCN